MTTGGEWQYPFGQAALVGNCLPALIGAANDDDSSVPRDCRWKECAYFIQAYRRVVRLVSLSHTEELPEASRGGSFVVDGCIFRRQSWDKVWICFLSMDVAL